MFMFMFFSQKGERAPHIISTSIYIPKLYLYFKYSLNKLKQRFFSSFLYPDNAY